MALNLGELLIQMGVDTKQIDLAQKKTRKFTGEVDKSGKKVQRSTGIMSKGFDRLVGSINPSILAIGGASAAFAGLIALTVKSTKAFADFEVQQVTHQALLRQTQYASGQTTESLESLARSIGRDTLAGIQEARRAATELLTFTNITGNAFERTLRSAQDLAASGFGTLESNVVQLGKALQDPKTGLSALTRVGISFNDQQKETIKGLQEQNRLFDAQTVLLDAIEDQSGGAGAAQGQTFAGAVDTLGEEIGLLNITLGQFITESLNATEVTSNFASQIRDFNYWLREVSGTTTLADTEGRMEVIRGEIAKLNRMLEEQVRIQNNLEWYEIFDSSQTELNIQNFTKEIAALNEELDKLENRRPELAANSAIGSLNRINVSGLQDFSRRGLGTAPASAGQAELLQGDELAYTAAFGGYSNFISSGSGDDSARRRGRNSLRSIIGLGASEEQQLEMQHRVRLEKIQEQLEAEHITRDEARQLELISEQHKQDELIRIEQEAAEKRSQISIQMYQGIAGNIEGLTSIFAKSSREMFYIHKAAAIAQASVTATAAALEAYKSGVAAGGPVGLITGKIMAATALAYGVAQVAQIASQSYEGRRFGGPVSPGKMYQVNETGEPELLSMNGKDFLMTGGRGGQVTSAADMKASQPNINIYNNAPGVSVDAGTDGSGDISIMVETIKGAIVNDIQTGTGEISTTMQNTWGLSRGVNQ